MSDRMTRKSSSAFDRSWSIGLTLYYKAKSCAIIFSDSFCADNHRQSKRRGHIHQENDNHCQRDDKLGEHGANVPEQTSPPSTASVNHAFASDDFPDDRANHRTNEQADKAEEQSD